MNRKTHVLGVPFDVVTMDEAVARAEGLLKEKGSISSVPLIRKL